MRAYPQDAPTSDYLHSRKAPHPRVPGRRTFFRYPHSRKSRISAAIRDLYPLPFVFNCWTIRIPALRRAGARLRSGRRVGSEGRAGSTHMSFTRCRLCSNKKAGSSEPALLCSWPKTFDQKIQAALSQTLHGGYFWRCRQCRRNNQRVMNFGRSCEPHPLVAVVNVGR